MANTLLIKRSGTSSIAPTTLESGEIAINYADGKLFYKNSSNAIVGAKLITGISGTANQISVSEVSGAITLSLPNSVYVNSLFVDNIEIDTTGATPNYVLAFNGTKFVPTASGGALANLSDVTLTSPQIGQVIKYNGSEWINNLETGYNNSYTTVIGDGTNSTFVINHNFGTREIFISCRNNESPYENISVAWEATSANTATLDFSTVPASNSVRVNVYASVGSVGTSAYSQNIGDGSNTDYVITHNLQTRDIIVAARNTSSPYEVIDINWEATSENTVTAMFSSPPSSNSVRLTVYAGGGTAGVTSLVGTTNQIVVNQTTGTVTVGLSNNVSVTGNLTIGGNLTVSGDTTTINTATLSVEDNIITLNSGATSSPTLDAGIEVERGTSDNVQLRWNESTDKWELTENGTNYYSILSTNSNVEDLSNVVITSATPGQFFKYDGTNWINDDIPQINALDDIGDVSIATATSGQFLKFDGTNWVNDSIPIINSIDDIGDVALSDASEDQILAYNGSSWVNVNLNAINGSSFAQTLGNGSDVNFVLTHNLGTRDVYVAFRQATSPYDILNVYWEATTVDTITATFDSAPFLNSVRALVYAGFSTAEKSVYSANIGNGTDTEITVTHNLNTRDLVISARLNESPYNDVQVSWEALTEDTVKFYFGEAPNSNQIRVNIFANVNASSVGQSVTSLIDTNITSVTTGQFLKWDGSQWINANIPTINTLDDVGDVTISSIASGQFLKWNGSAWVNDAIDLGTDTTGNYVSGVTAGTGVTVTHTPGEGSSPTIAIGQSVGTGDSPNFAGVTADNIRVGITGANEIDTSSGNLTIDSTGGTVTVDDNLIVTGDLTVSGTTTTINTTELLIEDNLIVLNTGSAATPLFNAGIEVERGDFTNVQIRWNESTDKWQFTNDGVLYKDLGSGGVTVSDTIPVGPAQGDMWYESDTGSLFAYYDSQWIEIGGSSTYNEIIGTIQAKGDLLVGDASQSIVRLAAGTNNKKLAANSSTSTGLEWVDDSLNTVVDARGDILIGATPDQMTRLPLGSNGQVLTVDSNQTYGLGWVSQNTRNLLYNGAMQVAQRGTSATIGTSANGTYYSLDRWSVFLSNGGNWLMSKALGPSQQGFPSSLQMYVNDTTPKTSAGYCYISQKLEGQDLQAIKKGTANAESLTVSFWIQPMGYSQMAGTYIVEIQDTDNNRHCSKSYAVDMSGWQFKTVTFPPDVVGALINDNNESLRINFWLYAGSDYQSGSLATSWATTVNANRAVGQTDANAGAMASVSFAGVQLNIGPVAAPFEHKSYGRELLECQRYYMSWSSANTAGRIAQGIAPNTTSANFLLPYKVQPRTTLGTLSVTGAYGVSDTAAFQTGTAMTRFDVTCSDAYFSVTVTVASGLAQFRPCFLESNAGNLVVASNMEL